MSSFCGHVDQLNYDTNFKKDLHLSFVSGKNMLELIVLFLFVGSHAGRKCLVFYKSQCVSLRYILSMLRFKSREQLSAGEQFRIEITRKVSLTSK